MNDSRVDWRVYSRKWGVSQLPGFNFNILTSLVLVHVNHTY